MTTPTPGNAVPAAFRHLLAQILLNLRDGWPVFRIPVASFGLAGAWGAFLYLTGVAEALGSRVPWYVSGALFLVFLLITVFGFSARRPDTFPHERAWRRVKTSFLAVAIIAGTTGYTAFLFA